MTVYVVDLESISTRYTCEWKTKLPNSIALRGHDVVVIDGPEDLPDCTTPGAFLNFPATNIYKSEQVRKIAQLFSENKIQSGDQFLFTDAWHPGIINLKYMADLLEIDVVTHGLWHAGSYDPNDFLGRLVGNEGWARHAEMAMFECYTHNWFATQEHIRLFQNTLLRDQTQEQFDEYRLTGKISRTGWPMEYLATLPWGYEEVEKQDKIIFPHRLAPEKQVEIFRDLADQLPEYEFFICQEHKLTKSEYHRHLAQSKIVFSANLQETLGITTCGEGPLFGAVPLAPARLTYTEIFASHEEFLYPCHWTRNWDSYLQYRDELVKTIRATMNRYDQLEKVVKNYNRTALPRFFGADNLMNVIDSHEAETE